LDKLSQSINNLEVKVNELGSKYSAILREVKMLRTRNIELQKQIEDKEKVIADLTNRKEVIKEEESVESNYQIKVKIEQLVKEVDGCIAMLNQN
jgi:uncharacterized coiled-coil DUF342 family protein